MRQAEASGGLTGRLDPRVGSTAPPQHSHCPASGDGACGDVRCGRTAGAAMQVGTSWNSFYLGVRWGIGHSTGLFIIAVAFLALKGHMDLEKFAALDGLVGVVMIALGVYGIAQVPPLSPLLCILIPSSLLRVSNRRPPRCAVHWESSEWATRVCARRPRFAAVG
jgi:hypothetical protein